MKDIKSRIQHLNLNTIPCSDLMEALAYVMKEEKFELTRDILEKDFMPMSNFANTVIQNDQGSMKTAAQSGMAQMVPALEKATPQFIDQVYKDFNNYRSDQAKLNYILMVLVHSASLGGGLYLGYSAAEGKLGNALTHPTAPGIVIWLSSAMVLRALERAEKRIAKNSPSQEVIKEFATIIRVLSHGFGFGLKTHLPVDTFVQTGGPIRFHQMGLPRPKKEDMAYVAVMSYFAQLIGPEGREQLRKKSA